MVEYAATTSNRAHVVSRDARRAERDLTRKGEEPIAFDHDCREGICGSCGFMINGVAHGPLPGTTVCQLHMRHFKDGDELYLEPWRARAFPIVKDLAVDRGAFDRIIAAGGFISVSDRQRAGRQRDSGAESRTPIAPWMRRPASAAALVWRLARTPRRRCSPEQRSRISVCCRRDSRNASDARSRMVAQVNEEMFGNCTNIGECEAVCPKSIRARSDRADESRLPQGFVVKPP